MTKDLLRDNLEAFSRILPKISCSRNSGPSQILKCDHFSNSVLIWLGGGESYPPAPRIEPTNNILTVLILYDSESSPTVVVVVVVVVVGYATPAPVLCARFASDFANADFAKDDVANG